MTMQNSFSRRALLASMAAAPMALRAAYKKIPVGLEMYSVRNELKKDPQGTVRAVAAMGYDGLEFFAPYFDWTAEDAKQMRKVLDDSGIRCFSTHNGPKSFTPDGLEHASELNQILGSKFIVMASAGKVEGLDGWKKVAETLSQAAEKVHAVGLRTGYHNHQAEFKMMGAERPIDVLAANTGKNVMLQLDVGTCIEAGSDPVEWIDKHPGRIESLHCKEWSPEAGKGYSVLFGEGVAPWPKIFQAAEHKGGVEYYLIEQEGSRFPELETAKRCLESFKKMRA